MNLSGQLSDWTVDELIQIVQVTKKTGSLDILGDKKGRIHFRQGQLTGAELHGQQGVYAGTDEATISDIIFVLGSIDTGEFAMGPDDGPESDGHDAEVISEGVSQLRTLESDLTDAGVLDAASVAIDTEIQKAVEVEPDDWRALSSLIPPFTTESLENRFGRGATVRMLHVFHRLGLLKVLDEPVEEDVTEESDWLDKLADEVSATDSTNWLDESSDPVVAEAQTEVADEGKHSERRVESLENMRGVSADPSTTLTTGVYDEIRRLRSKPGK